MPEKKDKDANYGEKLLKLFRRLMCNPGKHYQIELAEWLQCSKQSIIRLMRDIEKELGANLESGFEDRRKWYRMLAHHKNAFNLGLNFEELHYLSICRELAEPYLSQQTQNRIDESIQNLAMLLANPRYDHRQKTHYQFFSKGRIDYTPHHDNIEKLVSAIQNKYLCLISYKAPANKYLSKHRLAPGQIICMNNALYVLGAVLAEDCQTINYFTNLAIHRIKSLTLTEKSFAVAIPNFDNNLFGLPYHEPYTYRIHFSGDAVDYVSERIWSDQQKIIQNPDGSIILEIVSQSEVELEAWVRSFGDKAKFLPEEDQIEINNAEINDTENNNSENPK